MDSKLYILDSEEIAAGADKLMLDLYNAGGSNLVLNIKGIYVLPKSDVAVTGVVSARFNIFRTSAVGTSGTTAGYAETGVTKTQINPLDTKYPALPSQITARSAPTGGATISAYITKSYAFSEETNAAAVLQQYQNILEPLTECGGSILVRPTEGILIKQGSVASVNSYSFKIVFETQELNNAR